MKRPEKFPFLYTFLTRIRPTEKSNTLVPLAGYLALELIPLMIGSNCGFNASIAKALLLYALWLDIYEIGYLFNDLKDRHTDGELNRFPSGSANWSSFILFRLIVGVALLLAIFLLMSPRVAFLALTLNAAVLALLFLHSSRAIRAIFPGRACTFTALSFYKYLPILAPPLGLYASIEPLAAIFFFYGLPRTLNYELRKYGRPEYANVPRTQLKVQAGLLIASFPVVAILFRDDHWLKTPAAIELWLYFSLLVSVQFVLRILKRHVNGWRSHE